MQRSVRLVDRRRRQLLARAAVLAQPDQPGLARLGGDGAEWHLTEGREDVQPEVVGVDLAGARREINGVLEPLGGEVAEVDAAAPQPDPGPGVPLACVRNVFVTMRPVGPRTRAS